MRIILTASLLILAAGCSSELETGYKPRPIGVSSEERKSYYAPAFSPESQAATEGEVKELKLRRPEGY